MARNRYNLIVRPAPDNHTGNEHKCAVGWQKGPYNKIWKIERHAYFENYTYAEPFLNFSIIYHKR